MEMCGSRIRCFETGKLFARRGSGLWSVVGRLRPDVTFEKAQTEMSAIARGLDEQLPATDRNLGISVVPLRVQLTGRNARLALWMRTGAVLCVLLDRCDERGESLTGSQRQPRERVRCASGAWGQPWENHSAAAGRELNSGVAMRDVGLDCRSCGYSSHSGEETLNLVRLNEVSLDPRALGSTLALCLLTAILVGLAPAITLGRRTLQPTGQEGGRGIAGGIATRRIRRALVVTEFALAIVLLVGAGLPVRSRGPSRTSIRDSSPACVLSMQLSTTSFRATAQRTNFYNDVLEQIQMLPGVELTAIIGDFFCRRQPGTHRYCGSGHPNCCRAKPAVPERRGQSGILQGRWHSIAQGAFLSSATDGPESPPVAIIGTVATARRLWPGLDSLGKRFKVGAADSASPAVPRWWESLAICVVRDWKRTRFRKSSIRWRKTLPVGHSSGTNVR